ncbi:magnesium transporter [Methylomarinovum caldicuralii]|uniref:Magnesium transporter n=1 Tax=Methylomarinovum caldicuralii TaxID=438856 RepID=A0AAU9CPJ4_9GAMM|nr:magnesium transporter [Methylomarinovum caldicuralii]BCX81447.1 magnesium transporter [Methylomarinovum caldicuralii]
MVDDVGRFLGLVPAGRLVAAAEEQPLQELMVPAPTVSPDTPLSEAVAQAGKTGAAVLAVVDEEGRLAGLLPAEILLGRMHDRYGEALKRFTGIRENSEQAVSAIEGQPFRRLPHRLPWLLVGTFGSMIATAVMAGFEDVLRRDVEVAFFIPGLVYLADAIGTQSEAIAVRGLSFSRASLGKLWWGELQTGMLLGLTLALLVFPFIWLAFSASLALALALSLIFASSVATTIGLLFPWLLARLGKDPAYGSGPIATIIQDLLSLVIYFLVVYGLLF